MIHTMSRATSNETIISGRERDPRVALSSIFLIWNVGRMSAVDDTKHRKARPRTMPPDTGPAKYQIRIRPLRRRSPRSGAPRSSKAGAADKPHAGGREQRYAPKRPRRSWQRQALWRREDRLATTCSAGASCGGFLSSACGACAWRFLLFVVFSASP